MPRSMPSRTQQREDPGPSTPEPHSSCRYACDYWIPACAGKADKRNRARSSLGCSRPYPSFGWGSALPKVLKPQALGAECRNLSSLAGPVVSSMVFLPSRGRVRTVRSRWQGPGFEDGIWCNGPEPYPVTGSLRFAAGSDAANFGYASRIWQTGGRSTSGAQKRERRKLCHLGHGTWAGVMALHIPTSQPPPGKSGAPAIPFEREIRTAETPGREPAAGLVLAAHGVSIPSLTKAMA